MNAIVYPIFIHSNGTSNMDGQDFVCFLLAFMVLGVFMLIGSLIYSMVRAITSTYWGFNWHDIKHFGVIPFAISQGGFVLFYLLFLCFLYF